MFDKLLSGDKLSNLFKIANFVIIGKGLRNRTRFYRNIFYSNQFVEHTGEVNVLSTSPPIFTVLFISGAALMLKILEVLLLIGYSISEYMLQVYLMLPDGKYWLSQGLQYIQGRLARREITARAKNVIMFLGDGMSISTVTAGRIYQGQQLNEPGEESMLSFDKFPWIGLSKVCLGSFSRHRVY